MPAEKIEDLVYLKSILESTEFRLLSCQEKGKWEGQEMIDQCRPLGASRGPRKTVLVDVSLVTRFLQISDKQYILPLSPQATSRIPLIISMSVCKTKQKLLA